ncbi:MAG: hypothetical protein A2020_00850 [Lentisphaerae bacterium GWF2_45_14]|nr:MAG: hypothetical protein A2020_00850 [Lentisphaerae bacterium GWF2_45_14]
MTQGFNTRILVIDDDESVRNSFSQILSPRRDSGREEAVKLEEAGAILFNDSGTAAPSCPKRSSATFNFEYDEASNGKQGYEMVKKSIDEQRPYAAIFIDMRMPGWDGIETAQHVRQVDSRAEIIFVTAYSDYSIEEIVTAVGTNVNYHCKPFSVEEIEQIATKSVYEWNKTRSLEELIKTISGLRAQHWEINALLNNILQQVAFLLGTHSALIAIKKNSGYEKILAIGNLCDEKLSEKYLNYIPEMLEHEVFQNKDFAYFKLDELGILAIFEKGGRPLNNERIYIVRLFLEQAARAIQNVDLQEALIRKEKLSAVGEATNMIVHDLKNSIGPIELAIDSVKENLDNRKYVIEMLDLIKDSAKEGVAFVADILDYASDKKMDRSLVEAKDLFTYIEKRMKIFLENANVELKVECPEEIYFSANRDKLFRAITNLIKNASEAFLNKNITNPVVSLSLTFDEANIYINVSDNSTGIPKEIAEQIFIPFVTSGKFGGIGLGLAVVKQIVEAHNGSISIDTSSSGTTFKIIIPKEDDLS